MNANQHTRAIVANAKDPRFRHLRSVRTPQGPSRSGLYLIEGIRHLARAVEENAPVESVFYAPSALSNTFGQRLVRELRRDGAAAIEIASALYREITLAADPQGLVAVIGAGADPRDPAAIRATMRAIFAVKLARATIGEFARWARSNDVAIVGSSPAGHLDYGSIR